ncbi:MAG TPA: sugar ABC transporter permease [Phototrophicaceae bacterium]|nr:sugar ABC transporter permease [Phototrophicaceae bacterium]
MSVTNVTTPSVPAPARTSRIQWHKLAPYAFISPFFIIFAIFGLFPILFSGYISLRNWTGLNPPIYIGLNNYITLLKDPDFLNALRNTAVLTLISGPLTIGGGLILAVILNSKLVRFRNAFRTIFYLPLVMSLVVAAQVFGLMLANPFGLVNEALSRLGLARVNFLNEPNLTILVLVVLIVWKYIGNDLVIMLAGLQSIPPELNEAALVDGANPLQIFWSITVPLMRPVILFDVVLSTINTFNLFAEPYSLFGVTGGANQSGLVTGLLMYRTSFQFFKFGYGSAMAYVVGLIIFVLSLIQLRIGTRDYER